MTRRRGLRGLLSENGDEWSLCLAHEGSNGSGHMPAQSIRRDLSNHEDEHPGALRRPGDHQVGDRSGPTIIKTKRLSMGGVAIE